MSYVCGKAEDVFGEQGDATVLDNFIGNRHTNVIYRMAVDADCVDYSSCVGKYRQEINRASVRGWGVSFVLLGLIAVWIVTERSRRVRELRHKLVSRLITRPVAMLWLLMTFTLLLTLFFIYRNKTINGINAGFCALSLFSRRVLDGGTDAVTGSSFIGITALVANIETMQLALTGDTEFERIFKTTENLPISLSKLNEALVELQDVTSINTEIGYYECVLCKVITPVLLPVFAEVANSVGSKLNTGREIVRDVVTSTEVVSLLKTGVDTGLQLTQRIQWSVEFWKESLENLGELFSRVMEAMLTLLIVLFLLMAVTALYGGVACRRWLPMLVGMVLFSAGVVGLVMAFLGGSVCVVLDDAVDVMRQRMTFDGNVRIMGAVDYCMSAVVRQKRTVVDALGLTTVVAQGETVVAAFDKLTADLANTLAVTARVSDILTPLTQLVKDLNGVYMIPPKYYLEIQNQNLPDYQDSFQMSLELYTANLLSSTVCEDRPIRVHLDSSYLDAFAIIDSGTLTPVIRGVDSYIDAVISQLGSRAGNLRSCQTVLNGGQLDNSASPWIDPLLKFKFDVRDSVEFQCATKCDYEDYMANVLSIAAEISSSGMAVDVNIASDVLAINVTLRKEVERVLLNPIRQATTNSDCSFVRNLWTFSTYALCDVGFSSLVSLSLVLLWMGIFCTLVYFLRVDGVDGVYLMLRCTPMRRWIVALTLRQVETTLTAGSLPRECLAEANMACAQNFPQVGSSRFNCTAELLRQEQVLSNYCTGTVSAATSVAECADIFPCSSCIKHIECPVEICTVQFDGVSEITCVDQQVDAEFGCCFQQSIADAFWPGDSIESTSFACHNCRYFELPEELRVGHRWMCGDFCIQPTWNLLTRMAVRAFLVWLVVGFATVVGAGIRRQVITGNLMEVYREEGYGNKFIKIQHRLGQSHLYMAILGGGGLIQACLVYFARALDYKVSLGGVVFELVYVLVVGADLGVELAVSALLGLNKAVWTVCSIGILDSLLITSPWVLVTIADYRGLKSWFTFAFLGFIKSSVVWNRWFSLHGNKSSVFQVKFGLTLNLLAYLSAVAGFVHVAELMNSSDTGMSPASIARTWDLLDGMYLFVLTVGSLGLGNLYPHSGLGRAVLLFWTVYCVVTLVRVTMAVIRAVSATAVGDLSSQSSSSAQRLFITGNPDAQMVADCIEELFHPDHIHGEDLHVVCLLADRRELLQLEQWLKLQKNAYLTGRVELAAGEPLHVEDVRRFGVASCRAVIILGGRANEDLRNIARYLNIRRYSWHVSVVLCLHHEEHKTLLDYTVDRSEKLNVVSMDKFKLSLFGKACSIPTFLPVMCNLCKSAAGAMAGQSSQWIREYSEGVGMEIYETALSRMYVGRRFPQVAEDIYLRSTPNAAILVGMVEYDMAASLHDRRRRGRQVLINPGHAHVVPKDKQVYGIFIAANKTDIKQFWHADTGAGAAAAAAAASGSLSTLSAEAVVTREDLMKPLEAPADNGLVRAPIWDDQTGERVRSLRETMREAGRAVGVLHVVWSLVRMSRMTAAEGARICEYADETKILDIIGREESEILAIPGSRESGLSRGTANAQRDETGVSTMKRSTISRLMELQTAADEKKKGDERELEIVDDIVRKGNHYLVVLFPDTNGGLKYFVDTVRLSDKTKPIVVMGRERPSDWDDMGKGRETNTYFMHMPKQTAVTEEMGLELGGVRRADAVIVYGGNDTETVTLVKRIEGMVKHKNVPVFVEVHEDSLVQLLDGSGTGRGTMNSRYIRGTLYFASIVNTVCAGMLFNSSLQLVVDSLTAAPLELVPVTGDWDCREYMKLHLDLIKKQDLVPIALWRTQTAAVPVRKNFVIEDMDNVARLSRTVRDWFDLNKNAGLKLAVVQLRKFVGLSPLAGVANKNDILRKPDKYTVTAANQELAVREGDVILCLSPN